MQIEGKFKYAIYQCEKYGISIAQYMTSEGRITVTGMGLPSQKNINYRFNGEWVEHKKYGKQFQATDWEEIVGTDGESLVAYLSSSVPGIGKKLAERIVERYGEETLDIIDNRINDLLSIKGVSSKKLAKIKEGIAANRESRDTVMELSKHGISPKLAMKVYSRWKKESMDIIKTRPYLLCSIQGITFPTADAMGIKTEEYEKEYERFKACAKYVLYTNESAGFNNILGPRTSGSLGMDKDDFGKVMLTLLRISNIDGAFVLENTIKMIKQGELVYKKIEDKQCIFLPGIYRIEEALAGHIARLAMNKSNVIYDIDDKIQKAEKALGITLGDEQRKSVRNAFTNNLSLIIGAPGAGKTTTIQVIAYIYKEEYGEELCFMAPSGKAASRIRESSGYNATTVHSAIGIGIDTVNDAENEEIKIESGLVIVDEMSMLDARTAYRLFSCIGSDCMVVLCGDDEQLPSVGAGAVLRDMIDSGVVPMTVLSTIYRQDEDCNIYINSHKIRKGETALAYGNDFKLAEASNTKEMENGMVQSYIDNVRKYGIDNVMLITPFKDHDGGVNALNTIIQSLINPEAPGRKEFAFGNKVYRVGDPVMQLKNHPEEELANGDVGIVTFITVRDGDWYMDVKFPNATISYSKDNVDELTLAYAYTVHKAQGSEAKCVITCCHSMHSIMLRRNIFYTAITRAKEYVEIWGEKKAMSRAINTQDKSKRNTALNMLLKMKFGEFLPLQ